MQYYPYNSREKLYKSIFGAVADNEELVLRLLLHFDAKVHNAYLMLKKDAWDDYEYIELKPVGNIENYTVLELKLTFKKGLYWYKFKYTSDYGDFFVTRKGESLGCVDSFGEVWQLTVYDSRFKTPDFVKGGIIYQIFPDRFYSSGKIKDGIPNDRYIKKDWNAIPQYFQNDTADTLGNDYYGGDLAGIKEKLPYLKDLGVNIIYLNPIFEAHSNHRYNTADYMKIDPMLGNEKDFISLCRQADMLGIKIILDGVFSHTGSDSIYFNRESRYDSIGAYNSQNSKYISWYRFNNYPDDYASWWGIKTLPETNENDPSFTEFITGENGVIRHWMRLGAYGIRLDVADELPDEIIEKTRVAVKRENPDGFLLGEVWEDASNKISHGYRRKFLLGNQLDSVMNYPFYEAIVSFICGSDADQFINKVMRIIENYPNPVLNTLMNHIGTHDTARIISRLYFKDNYTKDRIKQADIEIEDKNFAARLTTLAATIQFTLPGIPSVFYGDEAGIEGFEDPFCRKTYPWGFENSVLLDFYKKLGKFRRKTDCLKEGEFIPYRAELGFLMYIRKSDTDSILVSVNRWHEEKITEIPDEFKSGKIIFGNKPCGNTLKVDGYGISIIKA